jgi:hypothetical protein
MFIIEKLKINNINTCEIRRKQTIKTGKLLL